MTGHQSIGVIDRQLIIDEKDNIDRIIATLALKEISQSTLIKKLCALSTNNKTRKALFEYNKLIRSIYTLKCILLKFLRKLSPAAWQHIHFTSYFSFYDSRRKIDIDKMLEDILLN